MPKKTPKAKPESKKEREDQYQDEVISSLGVNVGHLREVTDKLLETVVKIGELGVPSVRVRGGKSIEASKKRLLSFAKNLELVYQELLWQHEQTGRDRGQEK